MNKATNSLPSKSSTNDIKTTVSAKTGKEETKPLMVTALQLKKMIVLTLVASVIFGGIAGILFGTFYTLFFTFLYSFFNLPFDYLFNILFCCKF